MFRELINCIPLSLDTPLFAWAESLRENDKVSATK